jgi:hypothetical protein
MTQTSYIIDDQQLIFHSDAECHRVMVTDVCGVLRWSFGDHGAAPGSFITPLGLALVRL